MIAKDTEQERNGENINDIWVERRNECARQQPTMSKILLRTTDTQTHRPNAMDKRKFRLCVAICLAPLHTHTHTDTTTINHHIIIEFRYVECITLRTFDEVDMPMYR